LYRDLNRIGLRDWDPPVDVHRVGPVYWNFHSEGFRDGDSHFNWVGTLHRDWHFIWNSFDDRDRAVHYNWIGVINRDFDLDGVGFRDSNWDSDRVGLGLRNRYRDFNRVGVVNTDWNFNRVGAVKWDLDFNRERFRNRDFFQHGIRPVKWNRNLDADGIGLRNFNGFFDELGNLLPRVEASQMLAAVSKPIAMSGKTPF
jgi:hypothetical protein